MKHHALNKCHLCFKVTVTWTHIASSSDNHTNYISCIGQSCNHGYRRQVIEPRSYRWEARAVNLLTSQTAALLFSLEVLWRHRLLSPSSAGTMISCTGFLASHTVEKQSLKERLRNAEIFETTCLQIETQYNKAYLQVLNVDMCWLNHWVFQKSLVQMPLGLWQWNTDPEAQ